MNTFTIIAACLVAVFFVVALDKLDKAEGIKQGGAIAPDYSGDVRSILGVVYTKLRRGGVSLRTPWISGCIAEIDKGGTCPAEVAIAALIETGEDLAGSRYDTDEMAAIFAEAAEELSRFL